MTRRLTLLIALAIVATSRFALARPPNAPAPSIQLVSTEVQKGATETLANGPDAKWFPRWLSSDDIRYASVRGIERKGSLLDDIDNVASLSF